MLIDTQIVLWYSLAPENLSRRAIAAVQSGGNQCSIASVWEIAIKSGLGQLELMQSGKRASTEQFIRSVIEQLNLAVMSVEFEDACAVENLPGHHRDPFDRLIAAQCLRRHLPLVSADGIFKKYGVSCVW